ncbi:metal-dependent hydrolase [Thermoactinomyces mirandus]|uniref:Metal-dependent hydrolase n=1 Tax=Thermoactinomyces mirandus TaxID=2756294 RepID=A0A7W1XQ28_9BACL|nr:metal-dependent hydrolase [Thermoactinomyces mirandus]MBA4601076.1 metal-dependent hydrolase [Thermoactinomyces mirandus]
MDSGTHFVMGIGLFGLSQLDPAVTAHPETMQAVLLATVIGSEIPDTDTLFRLKGNSEYIRHHRGFSHSLPMILIWPTLITLILSLVFPGADLLHTWLWTLLAVFIHIFIDLFNVYGTQALRPISRRWIAFNILSIFDPFIFSIHLVGFLYWWLWPEYAGKIFLIIYLIIAAYIALRTWQRNRLLKTAREMFGLTGRYTVTPTVHWNVWNLIIETPETVKIGEFRQHQIYWTGNIPTGDLLHPAVKQSKKADSIRAFLTFTSYGYPKVHHRPYGYEVRWLDVRYHYKKHFPFVAIVLLDHEYNIFYSYVGWISREQLEKRVEQLLS